MDTFAAYRAWRYIILLSLLSFDYFYYYRHLQVSSSSFRAWTSTKRSTCAHRLSMFPHRRWSLLFKGRLDISNHFCFQILTKDSVTVFVNAIMYYKVKGVAITQVTITSSTAIIIDINITTTATATIKVIVIDKNYRILAPSGRRLSALTSNLPTWREKLWRRRGDPCRVQWMVSFKSPIFAFVYFLAFYLWRLGVCIYTCGW